MQNARRDRLALMLVAACALGLGACSRHAEEHRAYGSLKDEPVVTKAKPRPAKVAVAPAPSAPPARVVQAAPAVAVAEPDRPVANVQQPPPASSPISTASSSSSTSLPGAPVELPLAPVDDEATATEMLFEGQALFDAGKVLQARRIFTAAISSPVPDVVLALARSYDTYYLSRLPSSDGAPDMQRALVLYERAMERGAANAAPDLERTRGILKIPR